MSRGHRAALGLERTRHLDRLGTDLFYLVALLLNGCLGFRCLLPVEIELGPGFFEAGPLPFSINSLTFDLYAQSIYFSSCLVELRLPGPQLIETLLEVGLLFGELAFGGGDYACGFIAGLSQQTLGFFPCGSSGGPFVFEGMPLLVDVLPLIL